MTKLEKVINGLACCTKVIVAYEARCTDCPYYDGNSKHCIEQTQQDALELLRERQWISVKDRLPENEKDVLLIKQLKSGQRNIGIGYCIPDYEFKNYATGESHRAPYWVCSGNNNVVYWMPLPEMPEDGE